jgi:coenzyme F420 biosynthesis associated uncharacterized protein
MILGDDDLVDWSFAAATAAKMMPPGPQIDRGEAREVVAELHRCADIAQGHVAQVTRLVAPPTPGQVAVVDRPTWAKVNAAGFEAVLGPFVQALRRKRPSSFDSPVTRAVGSKLTGVEAGSVLAFLGTRVLGQYDVFGPGIPGGASGRLLLVAPNIVTAEREMGVDPHDFRLWVCLHEETHRAQFTAVPWLREHVRSQIQAFLEATDIDPTALARRLRDIVGTVSEAVRGEGRGSLLDAVQTPEQREILDQLTAVMSLLEGHADVVMDDVGPQVVPSVAVIRERFQRRRQGQGRLDQIVRRLLGLEAKMQQYREGAVFVRAVIDKVGVEGFNRVWTSPETLPRRSEIDDAGAWVARVAPDVGQPAVEGGA